ncbi:hypothetical protein FACS1894152_3170 [Bacilli bacterium]|nr:hypothetical protein FACS1894152_3170 [Bacilli bacterium]
MEDEEEAGEEELLDEDDGETVAETEGDNDEEDGLLEEGEEDDIGAGAGAGTNGEEDGGGGGGGIDIPPIVFCFSLCSCIIFTISLPLFVPPLSIPSSHGPSDITVPSLDVSIPSPSGIKLSLVSPT